MIYLALFVIILTINEIYKYCKENNFDLPVKNQVYKNNRSPIKFICNRHGVYSQLWNSHKRGSTGCKSCRYDKTSKSNRLSWDSLINSCKVKGYDIPINKNEYKNQNSLLTFNCPIHGNYMQPLGSHMQGKTGCKKCKFIKRQSSKQEWDMQIMSDYCKEHNLDLPKDNQEYINLKAKYIYTCPKHGEYYQTWGKHKVGQIGCRKCRLGNTLLNVKKLNSRCSQYNLDSATDTFKINDRFYGSFTCKTHNIEYCQRIDMHLKGQGCPICNESHGEKYIRNYLDKHSIKYIPQKRFNDLKDEKLLSYDFYLPDYNTLIEYQGKQHYKSFEYFGGEEQFKKQQYHDNLKREYAKDNGYKLLELSHTLNTQELVDKYLKRRIK